MRKGGRGEESVESEEAEEVKREKGRKKWKGKDVSSEGKTGKVPASLKYVVFKRDWYWCKESDKTCAF